MHIWSKHHSTISPIKRVWKFRLSPMQSQCQRNCRGNVPQMTKHAVILVGDNQNSRTAGERGHEQEEEIGERRARLARTCYATSVYRNASTRDEQGTIRGAFRSRTARPTPACGSATRRLRSRCRRPLGLPRSASLHVRLRQSSNSTAKSPGVATFTLRGD
jgi:hypothetical protein